MIDTVRSGKFRVDVLYEDNHLLVAVKPPNLPAQADRSGDDDLLSILKRYIGNKYQKPGNVYLGLVHRLDRPVGGVMVFARTSKAAARLCLSALVLLLSGAAGGVGIGGINALTVACLGLPGYLLLSALRLL